MAHVNEPIHDVAHLSHVELLTPRPQESQRFFTDVLSLQVVGQQGQFVYLRGIEKESTALPKVQHANCVTHLTQ